MCLCLQAASVRAKSIHWNVVNEWKPLSFAYDPVAVHGNKIYGALYKEDGAQLKP